LKRTGVTDGNVFRGVVDAVDIGARDDGEYGVALGNLTGCVLCYCHHVIIVPRAVPVGNAPRYFDSGKHVSFEVMAETLRRDRCLVLGNDAIPGADVPVTDFRYLGKPDRWPLDVLPAARKRIETRFGGFLVNGCHRQGFFLEARNVTAILVCRGDLNVDFGAVD
jgi:hypothetical protein